MGGEHQQWGREAAPARGTRFATTEWGLVAAAGEAASGPEREALNDLLRSYWYPLYAQVRRRGYPPADAEDLTQAFLYQMVSRQRLRQADSSRGRFRSFLLASLQHFLANERASRHALKRGGQAVVVPFPAAEAERRWQVDRGQTLTPERAYDLHWVLNLLGLVLARIRGELASTGQAHVFEVLKPFLTTEAVPPRYAEVSAILGLTEPGARMAVHRLRQRYRILIREEIARTLIDPGTVESEIESLLAALRAAT